MKTYVFLPCLLLGACARPPDDPPQRPALPVTAIVAKRVAFQETVELLGTVRAKETAAVVAPLSGSVTYAARFAGGVRTGDEVKAGEVIATLDSESARHALAEARIQAEAAEADLGRLERGRAAGVVSEVERSKAEVDVRLARERVVTAEREAHRTELLAPRSGRLLVKTPQPSGSDVAAGTVLAEILTDGPSRVEGVAAASARSMLRPGLSVKIKVPSEEGEMDGVLREVAPQIDEAGTVHVVVDLAAQDSRLVPGEGVEVTVLVEPREAIRVPEEALSITGDGNAVFVLEPSPVHGGQLRCRRAMVEVGSTGGGQVEIKQGLREGDRIAATGVAFLEDGIEAVDVEPPATVAAGR